MTPFAYTVLLVVPGIASSWFRKSKKNPEMSFQMGFDKKSCYKEYDGGTLSLDRVYNGGYSVSLTADSRKHHTFVDYFVTPEKNATLKYMTGKKAPEGQEYMVGTSVEGPYDEIQKEFFKYNPFAHLMDAIMEKLNYDMNKSKCSSLFKHIEKTPPAGYEASDRRWLYKFVKDKKRRALKVLERSPRAESLYLDDDPSPVFD
ncbi:hypothetical protein FOZ63_021280 [Perkinsus olseni]|uniref:Uncharacterized protein n=1 Tax=Perkinsus olseni TaxID=32597 RepID=A0A7J6SNR9_PEROL|nr:hypothetical protein FOZ62_020986 [Perkinsus olseni]KAF4757608.1 hypothetical protein FOZ63_021280 [Perkinsus olseni]